MATEIQGTFTEMAGLSAGTLNADLVAPVDVSTYKALSLHINMSAYSGSLSFLASNDNVNFLAINMCQPGFTNLVQNTGATNVMFYTPVFFRYFRVTMTSYTSGAAKGTLELYTQSISTLSANTNQNGVWNFAANANTSGTGTSDFHLISAATTNANNIKNTPGQIYGYELGNNGAADAWVKLYNTAGTPTAGTGTPFRTIYVPKGSSKSFHSSTGLTMGTGIGLTITGGAADADATAVALSQVTVEIDYK